MGDWVKWRASRNSRNPLPYDTLVSVLLDSGEVTQPDRAQYFYWDSSVPKGDRITAYRIAEDNHG